MSEEKDTIIDGQSYLTWKKQNGISVIGQVNPSLSPRYTGIATFCRLPSLYPFLSSPPR